MTTYKPATRPPTEPAADTLPAAVQRYLDGFPDVRRSLQELHERYGKHAVTADHIRAELDAQLGQRTLSAELYKMRGK